MILDRVERYVIEQGGGGIVLRMRQGRRAMGLALLSLAVLLVSWWFGPYGPRPAGAWARSDWFYWIWSGFFSLAVLFGLVGALYREDWTISEEEIVVVKSLGPWDRTRRVPRARSLGVRVEVSRRADDTPIFPYRLCLLDAERQDQGLWMEFQGTRSVDRFLAALRSVLDVDVEDARSHPPSTASS